MASLIQCLNMVLEPECANFYCIYADDLLVFSENIPTHVVHLNIILRELRDAGMTVKLRKPQFIRKEVTFLGHIVSQKGIKFDPARINSIVNFPIPRNIKELRAFLRLINYEHRFCPIFSQKIEPLLLLLRKNKSWIWKTEQQAALRLIAEAIDSLDFVYSRIRFPYRVLQGIRKCYRAHIVPISTKVSNTGATRAGKGRKHFHSYCLEIFMLLKENCVLWLVIKKKKSGEKPVYIF